MKRKFLRLTALFVTFTLIVAAIPTVTVSASPAFPCPEGCGRILGGQNPDNMRCDCKLGSIATDFAADLFRRAFAEEPDKNTLVSPLSVLLALAMTANGANGKTLTEMQDVLGRGTALAQLNLMLRDYVAALPRSEDCSLNIANSIWYDDTKGFAILEEFLSVNQKYYDAQIVNSDFSDPATVDAINDWVSEKTEEMITEIIGEIGDEIIMFLINAIAFDAEWANKYDDDSVRKRDFTAYDGSVQNVDFLYSEESRYIETDNAKGFMKPYKGYGYSFAAILPDEGVDIADFIADLSGDKLTDALQWRSAPVAAAMPKFTFEYDILLKNVLCDMGMPTAFENYGADFSKLGTPPPGENIYIDSVLHKTFIEVDQVGTRAGAVTAVFMAGTTSVPPSRIPVVLDRPFVFAIVDNTTNLPIFLGSLLDLDESDSSERTPTPKEKKPEPTPEPIPEPLPYVCACRNCENCGFLGGAYGFGRVTNKSAKPQIEDALAILRYLVKLSSPIDNNVNARAAACITNPGSNEPKMADALAILRKIVKLSSELEK